MEKMPKFLSRKKKKLLPVNDHVQHRAYQGVCK